MTFDELKKLDRDARQTKPNLFSLTNQDTPSTDAMVENLQCITGVRLPTSYQMFLKEFGGGAFGLTVIFSSNPGSEWYLAKKYEESKRWLRGRFLPFSDDFAGGLYLLEIVDGQAHEPVLYFNTDGGIKPTEFATIFDYIARYAYKAE